MLKIGCHVSTEQGVWNAPKNASVLGCETFQIFTRSPQGGKTPELDGETVAKFRQALKDHGLGEFVVHAPYFVNFGSSDNRIYYGSVSVIKQELARANLLGAKYVMAHLGSYKAAERRDVLEHARKGLALVLEEYEGDTKFLMEISAGGGNIIGDTFEELAVIMEGLVKFKAFGGICLDTQHAFASGYDLRTAQAVKEVFEKFDKAIGLEYLKMSHINDSKTDLGSHKDRHEHIGEGKIGLGGFRALFNFLQSYLNPKTRKQESGESMALILETNHDKVKADINILKTLREGIKK